MPVQGEKQITKGQTPRLFQSTFVFAPVPSDLEMTFLQASDPPGWHVQLHHADPGHPGSAKVEVSGPEFFRRPDSEQHRISDGRKPRRGLDDANA